MAYDPGVSNAIIAELVLASALLGGLLYFCLQPQNLIKFK